MGRDFLNSKPRDVASLAKIIFHEKLHKENKQFHNPKICTNDKEDKYAVETDMNSIAKCCFSQNPGANECAEIEGVESKIRGIEVASEGRIGHYRLDDSTSLNLNQGLGLGPEGQEDRKHPNTFSPSILYSLLEKHKDKINKARDQYLKFNKEFDECTKKNSGDLSNCDHITNTAKALCEKEFNSLKGAGTNTCEGDLFSGCPFPEFKTPRTFKQILDRNDPENRPQPQKIASNQSQSAAIDLSDRSKLPTQTPDSRALGALVGSIDGKPGTTYVPKERISFSPTQSLGIATKELFIPSAHASGSSTAGNDGQKRASKRPVIAAKSTSTAFEPPPPNAGINTSTQRSVDPAIPNQKAFLQSPPKGSLDNTTKVRSSAAPTPTLTRNSPVVATNGSATDAQKVFNGNTPDAPIDINAHAPSRGVEKEPNLDFLKATFRGFQNKSPSEIKAEFKKADRKLLEQGIGVRYEEYIFGDKKPSRNQFYFNGREFIPVRK